MFYAVRHQQGAISRNIFSGESIPKTLFVNPKWDSVPW